MLQLNGKPLQKDKAFVTDDGRQFPSNWLQLATEEEKESLGIVEVPDAPVESWDRRFYTGTNNPRDLDEVKATYISNVKSVAGSLLQSTDWYVIRQAENSAAVPADVLSRRTEIRTFSNEKETAINACENVTALALYVDSPEFRRWEPLPAEPDPKAEQEPTPAPTPTEE
jgi:hypothetical protein